MSTYLYYLSAVTLAVLMIVYLFVGDQQCDSYNKPCSVNSTPTRNQRSGSRTVSTLQFVAVFSRHGSRAPILSYPKSDYQMNDTKIWPHGAGQLTTIANKEEKILQFLRSYRPTTTSKRCQRMRMRTSQSPVHAKTRGTVRIKISDCRADLYCQLISQQYFFGRVTRRNSYFRWWGDGSPPRAALLAKWFGLY
ncbi:hypothetical protein J6590_023472 [Homalodisca vitripennis]|nr:hypothetical protein J6590_023472 [Homalodisca vitripennis]